MNQINKIPLFPLNTVLLPEFPLPLHIFEERYKLLVDYYVTNDIAFGVVYADGNRIKKVGCTAKIVQVYNKYEDGKMDILTLGQNRFKLLNVSEDELYLSGEIKYFDDEDEEESPELFELSQKAIDILQKLGKLKIKNEFLKYIKQLDLKVISFVVSSIGGFSNSEKQKFLEMNSTSERLEKTVEILEEYYMKINSPSVN